MYIHTNDDCKSDDLQRVLLREVTKKIYSFFFRSVTVAQRKRSFVPVDRCVRLLWCRRFVEVDQESYGSMFRLYRGVGNNRRILPSWKVTK